MRRVDPLLIALVVLTLLLLLVAIDALAEVRIVGLDCRRVVLLQDGDDTTMVCAQPLGVTLPALLTIRDQGEFIRQSYETLLLRRVDGPGFEYWVGRLAGGLTRGQMLQAIVGSDEYRARNAGLGR